MSKPKILVIGHAQHGKDTVCEMLRDTHGFKFLSSSMVALDEIIWPSLRHTYKDKDECFADRVNHRALWFELIKLHDDHDPMRLTRTVLSKADIYCGMRQRKQLVAAKAEGAFDFILWVDGSLRHPAEPSSSMELNEKDADMVVDNNEDLKWLAESVDFAANKIAAGVL